MESTYMLTTLDNPYDPFNQFTSWYMYDCEKGYNTCGRIARIAKISSEMSQLEVDAEMDRAIDQIIYYDFLNHYTKVTEEDFKNKENVAEQN